MVYTRELFVTLTSGHKLNFPAGFCQIENYIYFGLAIFLLDLLPKLINAEDFCQIYKKLHYGSVSAICQIDKYTKGDNIWQFVNLTKK